MYYKFKLEKGNYKFSRVVNNGVVDIGTASVFLLESLTFKCC